MNKQMRIIDQIQMKLLTDTIAIRSSNIPQIGKLQEGRPVLSGHSREEKEIPSSVGILIKANTA